MLIRETVIWDMLKRASNPDFAGDRRHGHGRRQVPGGHGHANVVPPIAADDLLDVGRFESVSDHHLGTGGPQGRCPLVLAAGHGANEKTAIEEQLGHGSPDRPELTAAARVVFRNILSYSAAAAPERGRSATTQGL
jgi:hypothetical protein